MDYPEAVLLATGSIGPIVLTARALLDRKRVYATWAKVAYVLASLAGLAWATLGVILWPPFRMADHPYFSLLLALKDICAGIVIGLLVSIVMARPYEKRENGRSRVL
jgi:uncharacterized membrane protein YGL010W